MLPLVMYATMIVVVVLDELAEDAAHRDDVVVGMRREADDPLADRQLRSSRGSSRRAALKTLPFTSPGEPNFATSDDMRASA